MTAPKAAPRKYGQCSECGHYGSDCKCHLRKAATTPAHTPGPWTTDGSRIFHQHNPGGIKFWVAETLNGNDTVTQRKANARLIAAAPEMYGLIARLMEQAKENAERYKHVVDSDEATERDIALYDAWYETLTEGFDARALLARIDGTA